MADKTYGDWIRSNPPLPTKEYKHMAQQTAIEWLDRWHRDNYEATHEEANKALQHAKQMEKKQIMDAYDNVALDDNGNFMTGEQYYNQTYKTQAQ